MSHTESSQLLQYCITVGEKEGDHEFFMKLNYYPNSSEEDPSVHTITCIDELIQLFDHYE